jgi:hypothetical protein
LLGLMSFSRPLARQHLALLTAESAAYRRHDTDFRIAGNPGFQNLIPANDFTVDKDIDVGPHVALLSQHPISQSGVRFPQLTERFSHCLRRHVHSYFGTAASEFGQVT